MKNVLALQIRKLLKNKKDVYYLNDPWNKDFLHLDVYGPGKKHFWCMPLVDDKFGKYGENRSLKIKIDHMTKHSSENLRKSSKKKTIFFEVDDWKTFVIKTVSDFQEMEGIQR